MTFKPTVEVAAGPGGCNIWTGRLRVDGYAPYHRFYARLVGPVPSGKQLDHLCRNRACVNPRHLEPVTQSENLLRAEPFRNRAYRDRPADALASRGTHCRKGHEFTSENTRWQKKSDGKVRRVCSTCSRAVSRAYKLRRKGEAA